MAKIITGRLKSSRKKYGIVVARFNEMVTKRLLEGCLKELGRCGVASKDITVVWVPGSFELGVTALTLAKKKSIDAVIGLGAVIRGETIHFDLVAQAAAKSLTQVAISTGKPVIFGVLTTDTIDQALKRSNEKGDHKGRDAAQAAVEMVNALNQI